MTNATQDNWPELQMNQISSTDIARHSNQEPEIHYSQQGRPLKTFGNKVKEFYENHFLNEV